MRASIRAQNSHNNVEFVIIVAIRANSMSHSVFIGYAGQDEGTAFAICRALEDAGIACWITPRNRNAADIADAIARCRVALLLVTRSANVSADVRHELRMARQSNKTVLPVCIEPVEPSSWIASILSSAECLHLEDQPAPDIGSIVSAAERALSASSEPASGSRGETHPPGARFASEQPIRTSAQRAETISFLFTDIARSTQLWQEQPEGMAEAV